MDDIPIYETVQGKNMNVESFKECDTVVFTSPSTVKNMIGIVGEEELRNKRIISIGPITSKTLVELGMSFEECESSSDEGIINKLIEK